MPKPIPSYLRLYTERLLPTAAEDAAHGQWISQVCQPFFRHTEWRLAIEPQPPVSHDPDLLWSAPVDPGVGAALGHISIRRACEEARACEAGRAHGRLSNEAAAALGEIIHTLATSVLQTRRALREREAELAACVPVVPHQNEGTHLAARLEAVLRSAAEVVGCCAAALYMLDAATTELKLRACWGLPAERLLAPPRRLAEAIADLEALSGHAVAIEQPAAAAAWRPPEACAAALCVPVSTPTVPLGTLWLFSRQPRPFTDNDQHVAEIVAGRLAADLERHAMLVDGAGDVRWRRQLADAEQVLHSQLPQVAPLSDTWDIAGNCDQAGPVGGIFYDWFLPRDGCLAVCLGECPGTGLAAALKAATLRSLLRGHAAHVQHLGTLMARLNQELWQMTAGDYTAAVLHGQLLEGSKTFAFVAAGQVLMQLYSAGCWRPLAMNSPVLGVEQHTSFTVHQQLLEPGDILVAAMPALQTDTKQNDKPLTLEWLAETFAGYTDAPARQLVEVLHNRCSSERGTGSRRGVLIIKRR